MKTRFLALVLVLAAFSAPCFAGAVHLTGDLSANFLGSATAQQIVNTFAVGDQPLFWGFGWEVIMRRAALGGDYMVSFSQDASAQWWLDWYAPAIALGFHPVGANHFIDPFLQVGLGCAGRVQLRRMMAMGPSSDLMISLFPFAAAGFNFNLDGFLLGLKVAYTPFSTPIPVTNIPAYPLGSIQVSLSAGFAIGW